MPKGEFFNGTDEVAEDSGPLSAALIVGISYLCGALFVDFSGAVGCTESFVADSLWCPYGHCSFGCCFSSIRNGSVETSLEKSPFSFWSNCYYL
jgi:hypothetical protein